MLVHICCRCGLKNVGNVRFARYTDPTNVSNVSVALRHNNPIPFWIPIPSLMIVIYPTFLRTKKKPDTHFMSWPVCGEGFGKILQVIYPWIFLNNHQPQTQILCQDHFFFSDLNVGIHFWAAGLQGPIRSNSARNLGSFSAAGRPLCWDVWGLLGGIRSHPLRNLNTQHVPVGFWPCKKSQHIFVGCCSMYILLISAGWDPKWTSKM